MARDNPKIPPLVYDPPQSPLKVLHKDEHILVLSKPSGLLSVPGKGEDLRDSLQTRVEAEFPEALLVHRLDMETSGLFLMAMNKKAQGNLGKQFERRRVQKTYIARVWGHVEGESGIVDLPLRCDWDFRPLQMVCYEHGKPAQTEWTVLKRGETSTLMELKPLTGRSHQLRVHMLELGHPILGDDFYGHEQSKNAAPRLLLHAQNLGFYHPDGGTWVEFEDSAPF